MQFFTRLSALILVAALWPAGSAQAQNLKVGFTDAELIVAQMQEYRDVMQQLKGLADAGETEYAQKVQDFQEKAADYQQKQALLSEQARQTREQELTTMQGEIQQFSATKQQEIAEKELELMSPLLEKVQKAIDEVAAEEGLNLVLNARAAGSPLILFAEPSMDITEAVMTKLGITKSTGASSSR